MKIYHTDLQEIITYLNERYFYENMLGLGLACLTFQIIYCLLHPPQTINQIFIATLLITMSLVGTIFSYFFRKRFINRLKVYLDLLQKNPR